MVPEAEQGHKAGEAFRESGEAYHLKSRNALKSMELNAKAGIAEWAVSASYYAKYFAVYALLARIGAKCEIHDCTIALFEHLFGDTVSARLIQELKHSKRDRVEMQYYATVVKADMRQVIAQTKNFLLEAEKVLDSLDTQSVLNLQNKLRRLTPATRRH